MAIEAALSSGGGPQNVDLGAGPATGRSDGTVGAHAGNTIHYTPPQSLQQAGNNKTVLIVAVAAVIGLYLWKK